MKLTIDWNCIIEVEEERDQAAHVRLLVDAHQKKLIELVLLAASASENTKSKRFPGNAALFKERIQKLGWEHLPIVKMPGVYGLSYWDFCYYVDDGEVFDREVGSILQVMFPNIERDPQKYLSDDDLISDDAIQSMELSRWRNAWCDVISAYSHIHEKRDLFITLNTRDFQKNGARLAELGMKEILTPREAAKSLRLF